MEWSRESCLKLIELYENRPELWNPAIGSFKSPSRKRELFMEIADHLGIPTEAVRKKIESLSASFRRERAKVELASIDGREYQPQWYAYKAMDFLLSRRRFGNNTLFHARRNQDPLSGAHEDLELSHTDSCDQEANGKKYWDKNCDEDLAREFDDFGTYIATCLKQLPTDRAEILQAKIQKLIDQENEGLAPRPFSIDMNLQWASQVGVEDQAEIRPTCSIKQEPGTTEYDSDSEHVYGDITVEQPTLESTIDDTSVNTVESGPPPAPPDPQRSTGSPVGKKRRLTQDENLALPTTAEKDRPMAPFTSMDMFGASVATALKSLPTHRALSLCWKIQDLLNKEIPNSQSSVVPLECPKCGANLSELSKSISDKENNL